jgi:protease-4
LYDKLGITKELLIRGQNAGLDSDYKPLTDSERAKLRQMIDATYEGFITRVATGRHRKPEEIEPLAQGRVWLGSQAKQNGLVDQLGGLDSAVELIRQKAKIGAGQKIALVPYPQKRSLLEVIMSRAEDSASADGVVAKAVRQLPGGVWIQSWIQGGVLKVMPYSVEIR